MVHDLVAQNATICWQLDTARTRRVFAASFGDIHTLSLGPARAGISTTVDLLGTCLEHAKLVTSALQGETSVPHSEVRGCFSYTRLASARGSKRD